MKDPRGVERGACTKCPCTAYELEKNATRAACSYCECPAPAHEEVRSDGLITISTPVHFDDNSMSSVSSLSSAQDGPIVLQIPNSAEVSVQDLMNRAASSSFSDEPTSDEIEALFPKKFGKAVDDALSKKKVEAKHKDKICQKIVDRLCEQDKDSNVCLKKAAKRMCSRFSPFKSILPSHEMAVYEKLKRRRNRLNLCEKKPGEVVNASSGDMSPVDAKKKMEEDWASGIRRVEVFAPQMVRARTLRQEEANKLPGLQLLRQYPALGLPELVLQEFCHHMKTDLPTMLGNWERALPNLLHYLRSENVPCECEGTLAEKTISVLKVIHLHPLWKKTKMLDKRTACILELFDANTPLDEMRPGAKDAPRLIATGDSAAGDLSIHCFFDSEPFFVVHDPVKAILLLLSAFFLFGVKWYAPTRLPMVTLCCCTAGPLMVDLEVSRNYKLMDFLKKIRVY